MLITWNPTDKGSEITLSNNNLTASRNTSNTGFHSVRTTKGTSYGKWYVEFRFSTLNQCFIGIGNKNATLTNYVGSDTYGIGWHNQTGEIRVGGTKVVSNVTTYANTDILGIAVDIDYKKVQFYKNNSLVGSYTYLFTGDIYFIASCYSTSSVTGLFNNKDFSYLPPTKYLPFDSPNICLIQQDIDIYSIKDLEYTKVGQAPVTDEMFLNYGELVLGNLTSIKTQFTSQGVDKGNLETGKYFEFPLDSKFKSIKDIGVVDKYTKVLLRMENLSSLDVCGNTVTNTGAVLDNNIKNFGNSSALFNGSNGALSMTCDSSYSLDLNDFTVDWWEYKTTSNASSSSATVHISDRYFGNDIMVLGFNDSSVLMSSNHSSLDVANYRTLGAVVLNQWQHLALVRKGDTYYTFRNGILQDTWINSSKLPCPTFIDIGRYTNINWRNPGAFYTKANIDDFRFSIGIARWISNFTPPKRPYYLIQDNNANLYKYQGVSIVPLTDNTLSKANFIANGMEDVSKIPQSAWETAFSEYSQLKVLMWTEDIGKTESKLICNSSPYSLLENVKQNNSGKFNILIKELN